MDNMTPHRKNSLTLFLWLFFAGLFGCIIGVPLTIAVLEGQAGGGSVNHLTIWLKALAEALFLLAPASAVGIWLGNKVGLGAPVLTRLVNRAPGTARQIRAFLAPSFMVGLLFAIPGLIAWFTMPRDAFGPGLDNPTPFEWLLRSLSAAITEEIFFRLGLMSLFVWIAKLAVKKTEFESRSLWFGNFIAALFFGAAHLPNLLSSGSLDWNMVMPVFVFNALAGLIMGWLYMRYGLLFTILTHFVADFIQHVMPRLVF